MGRPEPFSPQSPEMVRLLDDSGSAIFGKRRFAFWAMM
jgi:hypothetical protein